MGNWAWHRRATGTGVGELDERLQESLQEGQEEEHRKKSHLDDDKELGGQGLQAVQNL